jgi:hypothetical protein
MTRKSFGLLVAVICLALLALPISRIQAAESGTIAVTVTIQNLSVSVGPGTWAMGTVVAGMPVTTWTDTTPAGGGQFAATNDGNVIEDFSISVVDTTTPASWSATGTTPPGENSFAMGHGQTSTLGVEPAYTYFTESPLPLASAIGLGLGYSFDLQFYPPSSDTTGYGEHALTVTVTAAPAGP